MVRRNYEALVSGDGACAGCGEKSILRAVASRDRGLHAPALSHEGRPPARQGRRAWRTRALAKLAALKARSEAEYQLFRKAVAHVIMGLGGENDEDTAKRIADYEAKHGPITDEQIVERPRRRAAAGRLQSRELQAVDGRRANGMSRDDDGRQHRLQHRLWLHAALQSASVSVDELAVPGRRHDLVAAGRVADPEPRAPLRGAGAAGRRAARPRRATS